MHQQSQPFNSFLSPALQEFELVDAEQTPDPSFFPYSQAHSSGLHRAGSRKESSFKSRSSFKFLKWTKLDLKSQI
jgi:hypothetical protein